MGQTETLRNGKRAAVLEALRQGNTRRAACEAVGVSHQTFYNWLQQDLTLLDAVQKAEAEAQHYLVERIRNAASEPKHWQAAAWLLERRHPQEYAQTKRLEVSGPDGGPVQYQQLREGLLADYQALGYDEATAREMVERVFAEGHTTP